MRMTHALAAAAALMMTLTATAASAQEQSRFGVDVSEWSSTTAPNPGAGVLPIGGAGQVNGQFVTGERYGVQIGIRAQDRFVGPVPVVKVKQTGVFAVTAGAASGSATWNYDLHVDLRGAHGVAAGKTLGDYTLTLDTDARPDFFGCAMPCDLGAFLAPLLGGSSDNLVLFQTSQNPAFGNTAAGVPFDPVAIDTYSFTLTLTPKTFNGPPISARMRVDVR